MTGKRDEGAVRISRGVRDLLHEHVRGALERLLDLDEAIENGRVERAIELRELAMVAFSLFDALGWAAVDDRSEYRLPADGRVVEWLHEVRAAHVADLDHDRSVLARQHAGDDQLSYCGYSLDQSVAITRGYIARTLSELETIDGLLAQVCARLGVRALPLAYGGSARDDAARPA